MPIDYQRVLQVMEQAQADGLDEAATLRSRDGGQSWVRSPGS